MNLLHFLFFGLILVPELTRSASCPRLDATVCQLDEKCIYVSATDTCRCGEAQDFDIYFILDRSGSISQPDWLLAKDFVRNLVDFYVSDNSRIGIITFNNDVIHDYPIINDQSRNARLQAIDNLPDDTSGSTGTRQALGSAADFLQGFDITDPQSGDRPRLIIMITDGEPTPGGEVCDTGLDADTDPVQRLANIGVNGIVVRVTETDDGFNLDCMFEDPLFFDDLSVTDYAGLADILDTVGSAPCLTIPTFELTEFRLEDNGDNIKHIELYNTGPLISFDGENDEFDFEGTITGDFTGPSVPAGTLLSLANAWLPNSFLVLYSDDSNMGGMRCVNCDCSMAYGNPFASSGFDNGGGICTSDTSCCSNSLYLPIGVGSNTAGTGAWFLGSFSNTNFNIVIRRNRVAGRTILVNNQYDNTYPNVRVGYTFERLASTIDGDGNLGSSYVESCYEFSTPGDDYNPDCPDPPIDTPEPTEDPTPRPSEDPTMRPTPRPVDDPTEDPTERPTRRPTGVPTNRPTMRPTPMPVEPQTPEPTQGKDCEEYYYECKDNCYYRFKGWGGRGKGKGRGERGERGERREGREGRGGRRSLGEEEEEEEEEEESESSSSSSSSSSEGRGERDERGEGRYSRRGAMRRCEQRCYYNYKKCRGYDNDRSGRWWM